jgi:hypothetical protein
MAAVVVAVVEVAEVVVHEVLVGRLAVFVAMVRSM